MSVHTIRINGKAIENYDLLARLEKEIQLTKDKLNGLSREARRSKTFKQIMTALGVLGAIGVTSAKHVNAMDSVSASAEPTSVGGWLLDKILTHMIPNADGFSIDKENSFAWKLCHYMTDTLFKTQDLFSNGAIIHVFHVIWWITLSCTTLIVGKKGIDMIKAKTIGASTSGAPEFFIRLLASVLMSFFSLDVISLGIGFSNTIVKTLMDNLAKGVMSFDNITQLAEGYTGSFFWLIGFIIMFIVLGVRYWIRQINLLVLGCMTPVANMAWVTDGGQMLGTLTREVIVSLTTPIAQALTLALGTTVLFEVNAHINSGFAGFMNSMLIGLSTCFLMIFTPEFLRKFVHGSANPFSQMFNLFIKMKAMPMKLLSTLK